MRDNEFSHPGAEYNQVGQEFESAAREWNLPAAEVDRSGREYRQESAPLAVRKRKKRRINPAMATVAAVATAAVVISPINHMIRSYPTYTPSAASRAYLDYAVETVKEGDWDALLTAAADPRLDDVIREEFAPYAMELHERYGVEHTVCGIDEEYITLEDYINADHFHVAYDGTVIALQGHSAAESEFTCSKWTFDESVDAQPNVRFEWNDDAAVTETMQRASAYVHVYERADSDYRSVSMNWEGGEYIFVEMPTKPNHYYVLLRNGIQKDIHWEDTGEGTAKNYLRETVRKGDFSYEWIESVENGDGEEYPEDGGVYREYLEDGTVTIEQRNIDQESCIGELKIQNGSVQLEEGKVSLEQNTETGEYYLTLWYYSESGQKVVSEQIMSGHAPSEKDFLYHLY